MKIGILGAGSWGVALAALASKRNHAVTMWEFDACVAEQLAVERELTIKLPGIRIPDPVEVTNDICKAVCGLDQIIAVVPSQKMRATIHTIASACTSEDIAAVKAWIIASKGIELGTLNLMTDVILDELRMVSRESLVVLSGPSHAEEVSRGIPTTVVAASENQALAETVQEALSTETFRIYTNDDIIGVEMAASVKNVIALSAGICDGLGLGDNTKGALLTRGLVEMTRLGLALGARQETFSGLAGMGDLITTCMSRHSRNRRFGELIGQGLTFEEAMEKMTMVAEGVETTRSTYHLAKKLGIEMPITEQVYLALFEGKSARIAVRDLMMRERKPERPGVGG